MIRKLLQQVPWPILIVACLTLGLAPFSPPHLWQKLQMLSAGQLRAPMDIFDLFLHGSPWLVLFLKGIFAIRAAATSKS